MKKLLFIILLSISTFSFSQNTTQSEYLYMTKGLKVQLESGLDAKKGYDVRLISTIKEGKYTFKFVALKRKDVKNGKLAGIIVVGSSRGSGKTYYKAIPSQSSDFTMETGLMKLFRDDLREWDSYMTDAYAVAVSKFLSVIAVQKMP